VLFSLERSEAFIIFNRMRKQWSASKWSIWCGRWWAPVFLAQKPVEGEAKRPTNSGNRSSSKCSKQIYNNFF